MVWIVIATALAVAFSLNWCYRLADVVISLDRDVNELKRKMAQLEPPEGL